MSSLKVPVYLPRLLYEEVADGELQLLVEVTRPLQARAGEPLADVDVGGEGRKEVDDVWSIVGIMPVWEQEREGLPQPIRKPLRHTPASWASASRNTPSMSSAVLGNPSAHESPAPAK